MEIALLSSAIAMVFESGIDCFIVLHRTSIGASIDICGISSAKNYAMIPVFMQFLQ